MVYRPLAIFGMPDLLSWPESLLALWLLHQRFRNAEFLPSRCEKLRNIVNGIVAASRVSRSPRLAGRSPVRAALILILIRVMGLLLRLMWRGHSCLRRLPLAPRSPQFLHQPRRHFLQESRRHAGLGQIRSVTPARQLPGSKPKYPSPESCPHSTTAVFLDIVRLQKSSRMRKQSLFQPAQKHQRKIPGLLPHAASSG